MRTKCLAARSAVIGALFLGAIGGTAQASPGCDALRQTPITAGPFNGTLFATGASVVGLFEPGDRIVATVTGGSATQLRINQRTTTATALAFLTKSPVAAGDTLQGVLARTDISGFTFGYNGATNLTFTLTCPLPPPPGNANTDSQKLRAVQVVGSTMVAQNSGAAIAGAVDEGIAGAMGDGTFFTGGPNSLSFNFAAEPKGDTERKADDAFAALGYAGVTKAPPRAPMVERRWSLWANLRGTGFDSDDLNGFDGAQVNLTAGLGYKLAPNLLIGIFGGYETFDYDIPALTGKLDGDGATIGGYWSWRFAPTLRWDGAIGWSDIGYDASAGTASGSFDGSRWLLSTGLVGSYAANGFIFEPSAKVFALWENQGGWIDSVGTLQGERNFSAGRFSAGGKAIAPLTFGGFAVAPWLGVYADYYFDSESALPAGTPIILGLGEGWAGRVAGGVNVRAPLGGVFGLSGEYGGLGADFKVWTATARVAWPF